jgi:aminoglycoside 3-N-acetyltransferase
MFHSSLSRLGEVQGGAETVIDALLESVGEEGTIVAPTFCRVPRKPNDYSNDLEPWFDARHTPSRVGKISETFRNRKNALRSCHPTHSVAAIGWNACYIIKDHYKCNTPFSVGSPFERIMELKGKWLFIGVDIDKFTIYHVFEDHCPKFPYKVYYDEPLIVKAVDMCGEEKVVRTRVHNYDLSLSRIDNDKSKLVLNRVKKRFEEMKVLKQGPVGNGMAYMLNANEGMEALREMLRMGETIYLSKEERKKLKMHQVE